MIGMKSCPMFLSKLLDLTSTCVHDFDEDKAEEEKQSQHTITTFEAIEQSIKQTKGPCRSCMPTETEKRQDKAKHKKCNR